MALYDNRYWLLSHIHNSFISTDDTGMCELIMCGEDRRHLKPILDPYADSENSSEDDEDCLSNESYDLQLDLDFGIRHRSNTAIRLEKMEQSQKRANQTKSIKWEMDPKHEFSQAYLDEVFKRRTPPSDGSSGKRSLCTLTLKQATTLPASPYADYVRFDGTGQMDHTTKKYRIFLTMLPEQDRNYPLIISCLLTAKVQELIGLILLKCSTQHSEHTWKSCAYYGLYITEEDGEVDRDFPCLEPKETIAKFGFTCLGLVESVEAVTSTETSLTRTDNDDRCTANVKYYKRADDNVAKLSSDLHLLRAHDKAMEAPLYKSYRVVLNRKISKIDVYLGISSRKLEIDPIPQPGYKFALIGLRMRPISHSMDAVVDAVVMSTRTVTKLSFKIIYCTPSNESSGSNSGQFKSYCFESDPNTVEEIVSKINSILKVCSSQFRKEYFAFKEQKATQKKRSNKTDLL